MPTIRTYQPQDKKTLLEILSLNIPTYFAPEEKEDFETYLNQYAEHYCIVEENGKCLGGGGYNFWEEGKVVRLSWDFLHPDARGRGLGRLLATHRINEIKAHPDVEKIVVRTSQLAFLFYEKLGFKLIYEEKDYWAKGFDLYYMEQAL